MKKLIFNLLGFKPQKTRYLIQFKDVYEKDSDWRDCDSFSGEDEEALKRMKYIAASMENFNSNIRIVKREIYDTVVP